MSVTMKQVRAHLDRDEPDYPAAARLGTDAIPHLTQLVNGHDSMLASKAAYLASLLQDDRSAAVLELAASSPHAEVRVAAAAGIKNLHQPATSLMNISLSDGDSGVRSVALRSIDARSGAGGASLTSSVESKIRIIMQSDSDPVAQRLARQIIDNLP
jgi:predicted component of type VI protein secretion system